MRKDMHWPGILKRAACAVLFIGILISWSACSRPVVQPDVTGIPSPAETKKPDATNIPDKPELTETPGKNDESVKPTKGPDMTPLLTPTAAPVPTEEAGITPKPADGPDIAPTPVPETTPASEPTAVPTPSVTVTDIPAVLPTDIPLPLPTDIPDYEALLQNGWQRTEDFFGERDIFFSGIFDTTELYAVPGRYEYRYTSAEDDTVTLLLSGEEEMSVQPFLDELLEKYADCRIASEGETDYSYSYTADGRFIKGRIYACTAGAKANRMRVELSCLPGQSVETELNMFYLK